MGYPIKDHSMKENEMALNRMRKTLFFIKRSTNYGELDIVRQKSVGAKVYNPKVLCSTTETKMADWLLKRCERAKDLPV